MEYVWWYLAGIPVMSIIVGVIGGMSIEYELLSVLLWPIFLPLAIIGLFIDIGAWISRQFN